MEHHEKAKLAGKELAAHLDWKVLPILEAVYSCFHSATMWPECAVLDKMIKKEVELSRKLEEESAYGDTN